MDDQKGNTVFISLRSRLRRASTLGCVTGVALLFSIAGSASAATYPGAGSSFSGSAEGWQVKEATCNAALLCEASGGYDPAAGEPAGSLAARSKVLANAVGQLTTNVVEESPSFTAGEGGSGLLTLQRAFVAEGAPVAVGSSLSFTASLIDQTTGTKQKAIEVAVAGPTPFQTDSGAITLIGGHSYALQIASQITTSLAAVDPLGGQASALFDNVVLTGPGGNGGSGSGNGNGNGGNGGDGAGGLTNSQLTSLIQSQGLVGPAIFKGKRIFVKAKCPKKVGRACKVSVQGLLAKGRPATTVRTAKIGKGKTKRLVLKVKPKAQAKLASKQKLLFKETVKAGKAKTVVFKRLKLIKR